MAQAGLVFIVSAGLTVQGTADTTKPNFLASTVEDCISSGCASDPKECCSGSFDTAKTCAAMGRYACASGEEANEAADTTNTHVLESTHGGCCMKISGASYNQSYPLQWDEVYEYVPEYAECVPDITGTSAIATDGKMLMDMSATCLLPEGPATFRSVDVNFLNGSSVHASIIYHENGTVEAHCNFEEGVKNSGPDDDCVGPDYHDDQEFDRTVTYGGFPAERFAISLYQDQSTKISTFIDLDVANGCIPIKIQGYTFTDYDASEPAESLFATPPECFQQGAQVAGAPKKHIKNALTAMRRPPVASVV